MRKTLGSVLLAAVFALLAAGGYAQAAKPASVTCVGLYSETDAGTVSYRVGAGPWTFIKVKDKIPANAEIRINVDRDWVELSPAGNLNAVYEITGPESGEKIVKLADLLKQKPKLVAFPKGTQAKPDPKFKDKLVVTEYLGRQIYMTPDGSTKDIKYGDVLDITGKVTIIAINNTITLMNSGGAVTTVIGPLKFEVEKVLNNEKLYKFLNVPR
jgi:hypothetical protein